VKDVHLIFKIVVCGPTHIGKSCFCIRYVNGIFPESTNPTIGVDFSLKKVALEQGTAKQHIMLQLWDFGGEEQFRHLLPLYIVGTQGFLLAFDLSMPKTLQELPQWFEVIQHCIDDSVPIVLVGMKNDLKQRVSQEEINIFLKQHSIEYFIATSSLTGSNVEEPFLLITREVFHRLVSKNHVSSSSEPRAVV